MEENKLANWLENEFDKGDLGKELALEEALQVVENSTIPEVDADVLWQNIRKNKETQKPKTKVIALKWLAGVAAILLGVLFVSQVVFGGVNIENTNNNVFAHTLPDGSEVMLNTNSSISYDKDFLEDRTLTLKGEAFYKVAKGSTFTVRTDAGEVQVLGTSFNVFAREHMLTVSCKTGKVKVTTKGQSQLLLPGDRASLEEGKLNKSEVQLSTINSWVYGDTAFEDSTMQEVVSSLVHKYELTLKVEYPSLDKMYFTGSFVNNDLDKALEMVFLPMNIKYSLKNNTVLILDI